jgi:hypothetical protein
MSKKNKCTPEIIERMKENVRLGFTYSALSLSLGISEDTFYSWIRKGRDEGLQPYCSFYAGLKETEAELLNELLTQLKLSCKLGNIDSTKWLLEHCFSKDGYGKQAQLNVKSQNESVNLNINATTTAEDNEKIRNNILTRLQPRGIYISPKEE